MDRLRTPVRFQPWPDPVQWRTDRFAALGARIAPTTGAVDGIVWARWLYSTRLAAGSTRRDRAPGWFCGKCGSIAAHALPDSQNNERGTFVPLVFAPGEAH